MYLVSKHFPASFGSCSLPFIANASAARIFAISDDPLDTTDPFCGKGEKPDSLNGSITFDSCYFSYPTRYVSWQHSSSFSPLLFAFVIQTLPFVFSGQTSQSITRLKSTMVFRCRLLRRSLLHSLEKVGAEKVQHCRYVGRSFHVSLDPMGTCTHYTLISFSSIGSWPFVSMKLPVEQFPWTVTK